MNVLEHYVTEIIGEPYYDDYGSGNYHWWLKVRALCYGSECETTLMFDSKEEAFSLKNRHKAQRKAKFYINKCRSASCMQSGWKRTPA